MDAPQDETALCDEASEALAKGDLHKAADVCKSLLVSFPKSARGYHLTASLFQATGNYKKACDYSSAAAELDSCVAGYHLQQGQMFYILKEYVQAQKAFERAVELSNNNAEACRWLGNTFVALERFDDALKCFARARAADISVDTVIDEAECALQSGEMEIAEKLLVDYIASHPKSAQAHYVLAVIAIYMREFDRAENFLRKTLALDSRHAQANFYLALLLAESGDELAAMDRLLQALSAEPTNLPALLLLGGIFMKMGDKAASEKAFSHVLALSPEHLLAWYSLLELLHSENRGREGIQRLNTAMESFSGSIPLRHLRSLFSGDVPPCAPREFIAAFYSSFVEMFEPWVVAASHVPHVETLLKELYELPQLQGKRHVSLLDLGCGAGVVGEMLADRSVIRVGVDISPHMLKISRRSKHYDVLYDVDIIDYVIGSETVFDVVVAAGSLRWMGNLQPFFQSVRGVMHKDSILACMLDKELSTLAYSVANHGRYSHHFSYVNDISQAEGFDLVSHKEFNCSTPEDDSVARHMFFFKKMTVH